MAEETAGAAAIGAAHAPMTRSAFSWALYEGARNPYVIVCNIYIFAPYVATAVIGDPVEGQARIADLNAWGAFAAALTAPLIGAAADRAGRRKTPLALVTAAMALLMAGLWFVEPPAAGGAPSWIWFPLLLGIAALFPITEALHNAMLTRAASPALAPRASGLALALGNAAGLLILLFTLVFLALPGVVALPFVPAEPLFGLDPARYEPQRVVGVLCAVWFVAVSTPLFLYAEDTPAGLPWRAAFQAGFVRVRATLGRIRELGDVGRFLLARMIYTDAKTALIVLGGVYVAGTMGWGLIEMTMYGVLMSLAAVLGGFAGGWLDMALGPRRAVLLEIAMCTLGAIALISVSPTHVGFVFPVPQAPVWDLPWFSTVSELSVLAIVSVLAVFITAAYASSRTLMTRLAPPEQAGEMFGLYALAGTATAWLGPLVVANVTRWSGDQRTGFAALTVLLALGFVLMLRVRGGAR